MAPLPPPPSTSLIQKPKRSPPVPLRHTQSAPLLFPLRTLNSMRYLFASGTLSPLPSYSPQEHSVRCVPFDSAPVPLRHTLRHTLRRTLRSSQAYLRGRPGAPQAQTHSRGTSGTGTLSGAAQGQSIPLTSSQAHLRGRHSQAHLSGRHSQAHLSGSPFLSVSGTLSGTPEG